MFLNFVLSTVKFFNWKYLSGQIDEALEQGVEAIGTLVLQGFNHNIERFNLGQKYKYHKV